LASGVLEKQSAEWTPNAPVMFSRQSAYRNQEQHGARIARLSPLWFRQQRRVRVNLQVMAEIPSGWEIDRAAYLTGCIQRLLDASESGVLPSPLAPKSKTLKTDEDRLAFCSAAITEGIPASRKPTKPVPTRKSRFFICMDAILRPQEVTGKGTIAVAALRA